HWKDARAGAEYVRVVVLAAERGRLLVGHHRRADARDLVRGDRHADPGAADQDAAVGFAGRDGTRHLLREVRIVDGDFAGGALVGHRVAEGFDDGLDFLLGGVTGVVRPDRDLHGISFRRCVRLSWICWATTR